MKRKQAQRFGMSRKKRVVVRNPSDIISISADCFTMEPTKTCETNNVEGMSWSRSSTSEGGFDGSRSLEPQDADYSDIPQLSDEIENLILARAPRSEYGKFLFLNKRIFQLLKSGELFQIRREIGVKEASVFIFAIGDSNWWAFDREFSTRRKLPDLPADSCFMLGDRESLCAGSHLIVSGLGIDGVVIWRFELETNSWCKGPSMITPRCLFASASCNSCAFVAGGQTERFRITDSAEKYNPDNKSWESLTPMNIKRKLCSGFYMDNKFYVIGGVNEDGYLSSGEAYDETKSTWELIPNMLERIPDASSQSPPLVAVVNNELYSLETSSNELKAYMKTSRTWKKLGAVPVRADSNKGWGVAFKSLGNELLVMGASTSSDSSSDNGVAIYTCCPDSDAEELKWRPLDCGTNKLSNFIWNCSVMMA